MRLRFGRYTLDTDQRLLRRGRENVKLSPKAFDLLEALAENSPNALSKDQIHRILWPRQFVGEGSLHNLVSEIRRVFGPADRKLIRTVPRFGYALAVEGKARERSAVSRYCLVVGDEVFPLRLGDNVLGRGIDVDVAVERPGVSRHHARLTVSPTTALLEDLGSKNGTFVGRQRITAPTPLREGDQLFLGRAMLTFRIDRRAITTATEN